LEIKRSHKQYKRLTDGLTEHLDTETCVQMLLRDRKQMQARAEKAEGERDEAVTLSACLAHQLSLARPLICETIMASVLPELRALIEAQRERQARGRPNG
jgi:hypothetical protein